MSKRSRKRRRERNNNRKIVATYLKKSKAKSKDDNVIHYQSIKWNYVNSSYHSGPYLTVGEVEPANLPEVGDVITIIHHHESRRIEKVMVDHQVGVTRKFKTHTLSANQQE